MAGKKFIQAAVKRPGALTRKAKGAGMSVNEFAKSNEGEGGQAGQQSRFYLNVLNKVRPRGQNARAAALKGARTRARGG